MSPLSYIFGLPLLAAAGLLLVPRSLRVVVRLVTLLATFASMVLAVKMFIQLPAGAAGFHFEQSIPWAPSLGIGYHVGVDGLSAGLILMAAIVGFSAACVSWEIKDREKEFSILLLLMVGGILGAFASLDIFFLYFFHELALIPTFIMIGSWGRGEQKNYAAFQITLYLSAGALLALIGLIALCWGSGANTFDLPQLTAYLQAHPLSHHAQYILFSVLLFGFGILVSLWPFHTWAPLGYASAPTATAMMHAGVIKKFGLYALIRIALPLLPLGAQDWAETLAWLCLGNILYCGLVATRQRDLNLIIGNSSVAHVGFAFLGIASLSLLGITGAVVVMIAHGFLAALAFALNGYLYQQAGTLKTDEFGGLLQRMPFIGGLMVMSMLAGCGLPGFANFAGETLVLFGAWKAHPWVTALAIWGALVIAAVYMLRAIRTVLHGPLLPKWAAIADASNPWRKLPFVLLMGSLIVFGFHPRLLVDSIKPVAAVIASMASNKSGIPTNAQEKVGGKPDARLSSTGFPEGPLEGAQTQALSNTEP
jgi:NADH-quinone oxidoreductase subunit M